MLAVSPILLAQRMSESDLNAVLDPLSFNWIEVACSLACSWLDPR